MPRSGTVKKLILRAEDLYVACRRMTERNGIERIFVVVVEPTAPGNIGSIARAMANFSLSRLVLVNPRPMNLDMARDFACGGAHVIDSLRTVGTFAEAIGSASFVVGTTRRAGGAEPSVSVERAGSLVASHSSSHEGDCAIVFGREKSGLTREEKKACTILSHIETVGGRAGSLNISHAAALFFYGIFAACAKRDVADDQPDMTALEKAYNEMIAANPEFGSAGSFTKMFGSVMIRAELGGREADKLTRFFRLVAAKCRRNQ